jgi:hypothetical protein
VLRQQSKLASHTALAPRRTSRKRLHTSGKISLRSGQHAQQGGPLVAWNEAGRSH